ncbi:MAG: hypothetical protein WC488_01325 [Candidatus Micrarchaeia archaeon]
MGFDFKTKLMSGGNGQGTFALRANAFFRRFEAGFWMPFSPEFRAGAHLKRAKLLLEAYERGRREICLIKSQAAIKRAHEIYEGEEKNGRMLSAQGLLGNAECLLLLRSPMSRFALDDLRSAYQMCTKAVEESAAGSEQNKTRETVLELLKKYAGNCTCAGIKNHRLAGFACGFAAEFAPDSQETAKLHYKAFGWHLRSGVAKNIIDSAESVLHDSCTDYHGRVKFEIEKLNGSFKAAQG